MCKCNPSIRTPFCGAIGCEWPEDNKMKTLEEKIEEQAQEMPEYDTTEYTVRDAFYKGANFVKAEMQKEIDELENKNYNLRCGIQSYINARDEALFNENQASDRLIEFQKEMGEQMKNKIIYVCKGSYAGDIQENPFYSVVVSEEKYKENYVNEPEEKYLHKYILFSEYDKLKALLNKAVEALSNLQGHADASLLFPQKDKVDLFQAEQLARQALTEIKKEMDE